MSLSIDFTVGPTLENQISSHEIWACLEETGQIGKFYPPGNIVQFDGTISLRFRGRELLGWDYWIMLYAIGSLSPLLNGTASELFDRVYKEIRHGKIFFSLREESVDYRLQFDGVPIVRERLPLVPLVEAWTLLHLTVARLQCELGDRTSESMVNNIYTYYRSWRFDGLEDIVTYAFETPLPTLLERPREFV